MNIVDKAIVFAAKVHRNQVRKGTDIPYITHPFAVGMLLQRANCSEEVIAAGILHDTLEDTDTTFEELKDEFGLRIAILVQSASEQDKSLPWEVRKQHTIEHIKDASLEELQVIVADKLHNLQTIHKDLDVMGDAIWQRFNRGKREQHWYYSSIVKALSRRKREFPLIGDLEEEVKAVFGSIDFLSEQEISLIFECAYLHINEGVGKELASRQLLRFVECIVEEAEQLYRDEQEHLLDKLEDLSSQGMQFEMNSEGPLILAAFFIALQNKLQWSDQELFKYVEKNKSKL
ncbi:HD domain-containing protein [Ureibacillus suwonensis]|uniref:HD domain-containing protein n=1 Tax=Ureibacillus suwonensis TaxID=313007 RepID=A0ABW0R9P3_9BACL